MNLLKSRELTDPIDNSPIGTLELIEIVSEGDYSLEIRLNGEPFRKYKYRTKAINVYESYEPMIDHKKWRFDHSVQKWVKRLREPRPHPLAG